MKYSGDDYRRKPYGDCSHIPPIRCTYGNREDNSLVYLPVGAEINYYVKPEATKPVKLTTKYYVCPRLGMNSSGQVYQMAPGFWTKTPPQMIPSSPQQGKTGRGYYYNQSSYYQGLPPSEKPSCCGFLLDFVGKMCTSTCNAVQFILDTCSNVQTAT